MKGARPYLRTFYAGIVILWVVVMSILVFRHYGPETVTGKSLSRGIIPPVFFEEQWMGVYQDTRKIGYAGRKIEKTGSGFLLREYLTMELTLMNAAKPFETETEIFLDRAMELISFELDLKADVDINISGRVTGRKLRIVMESAGTRSERTVDLKEKPFLSLAMIPSFIQNGITPGRKFSMPVFDPFTLSQGKLDLEVEARERIHALGAERDAFRVKGSLKGADFFVWITEEGEVLREESPLGFVLVKEKKEDALEITYASGDLTGYAAVPFNMHINGDVRHLRVRLSGIDLTGFELEGGRQRLTGDILEIHKEGPGREKETGKTAFEDEYLEDSFFIQSKDPGIVSLAGDITGNENDRLKAARLIHDWVYGNIEKVPSLTVPMATAVLNSRKGDCNEHATLYAALARASGIPTRIALGLVHKDGSFYYHAWPEIFEGKWIAVDPTFGQFPADATHIRLVTGDIGEQYRILSVMGKIGIEGLEYK
jgi:hypothetical protein